MTLPNSILGDENWEESDSDDSEEELDEYDEEESSDNSDNEDLVVEGLEKVVSNFIFLRIYKFLMFFTVSILCFNRLH